MAVRTKLIWSKGEKNENGILINPGWKRIPIKQSEAEYYKSKPNIFREQEFGRKIRNEMDIFRAIQEDIQIGTDKDKIDELPNSMRQLLFCSAEWHVSKANKLFRIEDPESQARDGEWGSDTDDADTDAILERSSTTRLFLEQSGIIEPEEDSTRVSDILGSIELGENNNKEVLSAGYGNRIDVNVDLASISPEEAAILSMDEELSSDDGPELDNTTDTEEYHLKDPRMVNCALPSIPIYVMEKVNILTNEFNVFKKNIKDEAEKTQLELLYENAVDKEINPYLTGSLNSPFCARGYSAPRRKHTYIDVGRVSDVAEAADGRKTFFIELFKEAADCSSYEELFGVQNKEGFFGKIRNMNAHDRELSNKWSMIDRLDKKENLILSALTIAKLEYISKKRKENIDEESIRSSIWALYDREAGEVPELRDRNTGKIIREKRKWKDSIWRQQRTEAMQELFLTVKQWDAIYKICNIIKIRIKMEKGYSETRNQILQEMKTDFIKAKNLADLNAHMIKVESRKFIYSDGQSDTRTMKNGKSIPVFKGQKYNTYKFEKSMIDKISILDELLWRKSCARKRKYLIQRIFIFKAIDKNVVEITESGLGEMSATCYKPKCVAVTFGIPQFAKVDKDNGYLFIECEDCKCKIWLIGYKEEATPRTLEKAKEEVNCED